MLDLQTTVGKIINCFHIYVAISGLCKQLQRQQEKAKGCNTEDNAAV